MNLYRDGDVIKPAPNYNANVMDTALTNRAYAILHRMATERTGWRAFFRRWYFPDEPLRNDAANLVREAGFMIPMPYDTRLVGAPPTPVPVIPENAGVHSLTPMTPKEAKP